MMAAIEPVDSLPRDLDRLLEASRAEGLDFIERLINDWETGSNRFDRAGEVLLGARTAGGLVAVGGLNQDPYIDDPEVGRIRHVYVLPVARGKGVGRQLVTSLVDRARGSFQRARLRVGRPGADGFYLALGFTATSEPNAPHQLVF